MNPARRIIFRFFDLPCSVRMKVVTKLGLVADEDEGLPKQERYRRYFQRAKERSVLDRLWVEVEKQHADGKPAENPFAAVE